jgi:hypothetical protein
MKFDMLSQSLTSAMLLPISYRSSLVVETLKEPDSLMTGCAEVDAGAGSGDPPSSRIEVLELAARV